MRVAIVGTGFAGFGAVCALLGDANSEVYVFDVGLRERFANQPDQSVPNAKTYKGSYFTYGLNDRRWSVKLNSRRICSSHALGGHSTVYSGAILYPKDSDLEEWPEESRPRAVDYKAIIDHFEILHSPDDLDMEFPPVPEDSNLVQATNVGRCAYLGLSRVALSKPITVQNENFSIFKTVEFFERLSKEGKIFYQSDRYVVKLQKNDRKLRLQYELEYKQFEWSADFDVVFLGAGCVNTTGIVDRSLFGEGSRDYEMKNAGGFLEAFSRTTPFLDAEHQLRRRQNFPEFFLEINSELTAQTWSHTQITAINDQILSAIASKLPFLRGFLSEIMRNIFYFSVTMVHSRHSPRIPIQCTTYGLNRHSISIRETDISWGFKNFRRAVRIGVREHWGRLKLLPIPLGRLFADFFRGNKLGFWHFGGTLPMSNSPRLGQCSSNGEVLGLEGTYITDSAAFPEIPASTLSLLISAHAHRVAREWMNSQITGRHYAD